MTDAPVVVAHPPGRGQLLLGGLTSMRRRPGADPTLPDVTLTLADVMVAPDQVSAYRTLCGFAGAAVPPTFPHLLAFPLHMALMLRRDFPFPMAGLVHVANRIVQHRAPAAGSRLRIEARCGALRTHPRGQAFTVDVRMIGLGGHVLWESDSTYLHRAATPGRGDPIAAAPEPPSPARRLWEGRAPASVGKEYARLSGDHNPIHTSAIGARLLGFPRPIAHGMWSLARALGALMPDPPPGGVTIDAGFRRPLPLGQAVVLIADEAGGFALTDDSGAHVHLTGRVERHAAPR